MKILLWIIANWDSIAVLLVALIGLIVYIRRNGVNAIKALMLAWITQVEAEYGSGTGELKKTAVVAKIYEAMPSILSLVISERVISKLIEEGLKYAKEVWTKNDKIAAVARGTVVSGTK